MAMVFYITFGLALFINSFRKNHLGESIDFSKLFLCVIVLSITMVFIKANMAVVFPMYVVLLFFALKHKAKVIYRRLLYVLLILPIAYELLIDVPFVLSNWFFNNRFRSTSLGFYYRIFA